MRCAIYTRVSTHEQTNANQLLPLRQLAQARGYEVVAEFSEIISGAKKSRPELDELRVGAHRGDYQAILVVALDRLGRSMQSVINTVLELDEKKVRVVSLREPWLELRGPTRELLLSIFSWVAEQERQSIIERTNAGLARARQQGKRLGRPIVHVDLDRALKLQRQGASLREVARELRVGVGTLHRALASERSIKVARRAASADVVSQG